MEREKYHYANALWLYHLGHIIHLDVCVWWMIFMIIIFKSIDLESWICIENILIMGVLSVSQLSACFNKKP